MKTVVCWKLGREVTTLRGLEYSFHYELVARFASRAEAVKARDIAGGNFRIYSEAFTVFDTADEWCGEGQRNDD